MNNNSLVTTAPKTMLKSDEHSGSYAKATPFVDLTQWTGVGEAEDHPGKRKASGFFQPIRHLSGISMFPF